MDYIYNGEVQLFQDDLDTFLQVAKKLKVDGLIGDNQTYDQEENTSQDSNDKPFALKDEDYVEEVELPTTTEIQTTERKQRRPPIPYAVTTQNNDAKEAVDQLVIRNEDNFECKSCGKTTRTSSDIRRHVEIHIEGLSFDCQICGNTFRSRMSLNNHKKLCTKLDSH